MISTYAAMQNAILAQNVATSRMVANSSRMMSFGASQPLSPNFGANADSLEIQNKKDETKVTVFQKLAEALEKALGKKIKDSTPKYGGLDVKA